MPRRFHAHDADALSRHDFPSTAGDLLERQLFYSANINARAASGNEWMLPHRLAISARPSHRLACDETLLIERVPAMFGVPVFQRQIACHADQERRISPRSGRTGRESQTTEAFLSNVLGDTTDRSSASESVDGSCAPENVANSASVIPSVHITCGW